MQRRFVTGNVKYSLQIESKAKSEDFDLLVTMETLDEGTFFSSNGVEWRSRKKESPCLTNLGLKFISVHYEQLLSVGPFDLVFQD